MNAGSERKAIVDILIQSGADVNTRDKYNNNTALHMQQDAKVLENLLVNAEAYPVEGKDLWEIC